MSFLNDLIGFGKDVLTGGGGVLGGVARSAALGYLLKSTTNSVKKENTVPQSAQAQNATLPDYGVREQIDPDVDNVIPVVYGTAFVSGSIVDAVLTNNNLTMFYAIALCETTGPLLSTGNPSQILIDDIFWNGDKISFQGDGITLNAQTNADNVINQDARGLVKIWLWAGNSTSAKQIAKTGIVLPFAKVNAWSVFPNWTENHNMTDLVFAIIRVDYNKEKNVTGLGDMKFKIRNTLTQPGDVLNDYMTNPRYGAGIVPEEIFSE
jgi:hypothetical protein